MKHDKTQEMKHDRTYIHQWLVDQIPDYEGFLTVDELDHNSQLLAKEYPEHVTLQELATSPKGRPIYSLTIGEGDESIVLFGSPHPNEPAGSLMLDYFTRALAENESLRQGYRWHIIKTLDVDGASLNEPWFKNPYTVRDYAHDYYRSSSFENTEWTYPLDYKSHRFRELLEPYSFLHDLIATQKPSLIFSFRSTEFGPSCWYPRDAARPIWDHLYEVNVKHELPFHQPENDEYNVPPFAPSHFLNFQERRSPSENAESASKEIELQGLLVTELPRFLDPRVGDETYLDILRGEAARENAEQGFAFGQMLESFYHPIASYVSDDNPYAKMVVERYEFFRDHYEKRLRHIDINPIYRERCKVSEAFFNLEMPKLQRLLYWSLLRQTCEFELAKGEVEGERILEKIRSEANRHFNEAASELEGSFQQEATPIRTLVSAPIETLLIMLEEIRGK